MGAVTFSINPKIIETLQSVLPLNYFVETGTFKGETICTVRNYFKKVYSIELSPEYYAQAVEKFKHSADVILIQGDSAKALASVIPKLENQPALFWLDAHWCVASNTAGELSQCPLIEELKAIGQLHSDSVVLIDDARLFLAAPPAPHEILQWPCLNDIITSLYQLSHTHNIMVVNDTIAFYPKKIEKTMQKFAHENGIDWLNVLDKSRDYDKLLTESKEKEKEIHHLKKVCDEREAALRSKNPSISTISDMNEHFLKIYEKLIEMEQNSKFSLEKINAITPAIVSAEAAFQKQEQSLQQIQSTFASFAEQEQHQAKAPTQPENNFVNEIEKEVILNLQKKFADIYKQQQELSKKYQPSVLIQFFKNIQPTSLITLFKKVIRRAKKFLRPKLGNLFLYNPHPLTLPKNYYHKKPSANTLPTISIVTPSFKHGMFIERTLQSVLSQAYPRLEYIVQDGLSQDGTVEILEKYNDSLKHWQSVKDQGQSHAINLGFQHATGEIMAYLNSDDLLLPGTLHYVGEYFANHPEVDVVYGHRILIDEKDQEIGRWVLPPHCNKVLAWADYVPQETLFWRRSIWDKVGGKIDENFHFAMDWDLILRFRAAGAKFVRLPRFLGAFRIHPQQKTSAQISEKGLNEMRILRERCHGRPVSEKEIKTNLRTYLYRHVICHQLYRFGLIQY